MAWDKEKRELETMLSGDIPDWYLLYATAKSQIIEWILEDRKQFQKQLQAKLKIAVKALEHIKKRYSCSTAKSTAMKALADIEAVK